MTDRLVRAARRRPRRGFGVIAAMVVLVMMAVLSAAIIRIGMSQQVTSAQAINGSKLSAAAASGVEYGLYLALKGSWTTCVNQTFSTQMSLFNGWVTTTCNSVVYNEGETAPGVPRTVRVFTITATACTSSVSCPDPAAATQSGYVERVRQAVVVN
ncbi:MSHA biogenesis protein MshP [Ideonella paludis]|uniref:MSHA biogenesis protein MshP n=1 Tax=Ideonella paludis TaxID=1233411 RepID=A0ABS5E206_9BURK|nr:MSHA biogenesis protein MshP [Ideonella paludis]MBQ0937056.1 MSHA biogenesis protein MshP [Ideonella paludis]